MKASKNQNSFKVRAVRGFPPPQNVYDTTLTYQWNTGSTEPHFHDVPLQNTSYVVTMITVYGCTNSASANVMVVDNNPQIIYDTVCQGAAYSNNGFTVSAQETTEAGEIIRTRTISAADCESEITLFLTMVPGEGDTLIIYLPNAITPTRNDGLNDYFCLPEGCKSLISLFEIKIYNRWGTMVYQATDKNFRWDGRINGTIYFNVVYNYMIFFEDTIGRPYILSGTITVL